MSAHASDAIPCKVCLGLVYTYSVQCDCLLAWCHWSCVNLSSIALAKLSNSTAVWKCPSCLQMDVDSALQNIVHLNPQAPERIGLFVPNAPVANIHIRVGFSTRTQRDEVISKGYK